MLGYHDRFTLVELATTNEPMCHDVKVDPRKSLIAQSANESCVSWQAIALMMNSLNYDEETELEEFPKIAGVAPL
jgi:hypothetical protein